MSEELKLDETRMRTVPIPAELFKDVHRARAYADGYVAGRESAEKEVVVLKAELDALHTKGYPAWGMLVNDEYERLLKMVDALGIDLSGSDRPTATECALKRENALERVCHHIKMLEAERDGLAKKVAELEERAVRREGDRTFVIEENQKLVAKCGVLRKERDAAQKRVAELEGMHRRLEKVGPFTNTDMFVLFDRADERYYVCSEPDKPPLPPRPRLFTTEEKDDFVAGCGPSPHVKLSLNEISRGWWNISVDGQPIPEDAS